MSYTAVMVKAFGCRSFRRILTNNDSITDHYIIIKTDGSFSKGGGLHKICVW